MGLKLVVIFVMVNGCEAGDVYLAAIVVLADALSEKVASLCDVEDLVSSLDLGSVLGP